MSADDRRRAGEPFYTTKEPEKGQRQYSNFPRWLERHRSHALVDLRLPGESGLAVVRDLKALDSSTVVVVLTGYGSIATAVESVKLGAATYLTKPADADQIVAAFEGTQPADDAQAPTLAASSGSTSSESSRIVAGTSRKRPACSESIGGRCNGSSRSGPYPADRV